MMGIVKYKNTRDKSGHLENNLTYNGMTSFLFVEKVTLINIY